MAVFVPLNGPNDKGKKPKAPSLNGWQAAQYRGVNPKTHAGWYGLRMDGYICVDCDNAEAVDRWFSICGNALGGQTWVRRTPHGWHFIYRWSDPLGEHEHLLGPHAGVLPGVDLRQGRTSQIVYHGGCGRPASAPEHECFTEYKTLRGGPTALLDFNPAWATGFTLRHAHVGDEETWDEMPDGIGNNTMAALAGTMRKQGMSLPTMVRCLAAINKITMTQDPMPKTMIVEIARSVSRYEVDPFLTEIAFDDEG